MMKYWKMGIGALALGLTTMAGGLRAEDDTPGPIDSLQDLQDSGKMVFKMADLNNDGQISQREAIDAGNLLVGGFFFRADANGDGVVSQQEAQQARDTFLSQKPILRVILQRVRKPDATQPGQNQAGAPNSIQGLMSVIDSNNDSNLQATELRQLVQTGVQSLFAAADTNRDGQMSPTEVNAAVAGMAQAAAQASFQAADADNNGALSQAEFDKAIIEPAHTVFQVIDANGDGQLSSQELQTAQRTVMNQIRMLNFPEPANSASNLIETGRTPRQAAPVPTFGTPTQRRSAQPARPAQPAPAPAPAQPQ